MNNKSIIWIFVFIISINLVNAIGVSPGRTTVNFESGLQKDIDFTVFNNENKNMKVLFYVQDDPLNIVQLYEDETMFKSTDGSKAFKYKVKLPKEIKKPGAYDINIVAREVPMQQEEGAITVGATAAVISQLRVLVPYPGKYLDVSIRISETDQDEPMTFIIPVKNLGTETINKAEGTLKIISSSNETIETIKIQPVESLSPTKSVQLVAVWDTSKVKVGKYLAKLVVNYDGNFAEAEAVFSYGQTYIDVLDVYVKDFKLGQIAKFNILVENKYSEDIKEVYAVMDIFDEKDDQVTSIKSANQMVKSGVKEELIAFWDTVDTKEGAYDASLKVFYLDRFTEKQLRAFVSLNSIKIDFVGVTARAVSVDSALKNNSLMMFIIFVLVVVNIAWFVYFKRRDKKKS